MRPEFNVETVTPGPLLERDNRDEVEGFAGLYNFRHHFWVAKGSRLYGPQPNLTLNISQDLNLDLQRAAAGRYDYQLLGKILQKPRTESSTRIFTAVRWFNAANQRGNDEATSIVNLAIAFEALFGLPGSEKTDRLIDAISLLLGRVPRLDEWASQFYRARSRIVHEGSAQQLRFVVGRSRNNRSEELYHSLLNYGWQVFQLCLGTLLVGNDLAEKYGMEEKLVTNRERFQMICKVLSNNSIGASERFARISPTVTAIERYRFVPENDLQLEGMIGAARLAANTLLKQDEEIPQELKTRMKLLADAKKSKDHVNELEAIQNVDRAFDGIPQPIKASGGEVVRNLVRIVWQYAFRHYYWLIEEKKKR
jgi:hypothetical protein